MHAIKTNIKLAKEYKMIMDRTGWMRSLESVRLSKYPLRLPCGISNAQALVPLSIFEADTAKSNHQW